MALITSRQPRSAADSIPAWVGRLPTTTQPPGSTARAVVSPMPPGHWLAGDEVGAIVANTGAVADVSPAAPAGNSTMVVPVPWLLAASLKLLTSTLPWTRAPTDGMET